MPPSVSNSIEKAITCVIGSKMYDVSRERWGNREKEDLKEIPVLRFLCTLACYIIFILSMND